MEAAVAELIVHTTTNEILKKHPSLKVSYSQHYIFFVTYE